MVAKKFNVDIDLQGNTLKNPAFDAGAIGNSALATNPLARANHTGTQAASTISDLASVVQAYTLDQFAAPVANVSMNSNKVTNVTTPTASSDAATKGYVDGLVNGTKWLAPVVCATTVSGGNITLSGEQTIDGIVTNASRVLVKNQSTASQNGVYLTAAGSWTRVTDLAAGADAANASMFIQQGTQADTQWTCSNDTGSAVVGTNNLTFVQFGSGTGYSADGSTLSLSGTTFSVATSGITATQLASNAVTTAKILDANVTAAKLATVTDGTTLDQSGAGSTLEVKAGGIGATQLATNAVTTAKITDANVTTAKIADANVTAAKLATVTDGVTLDQLGTGSTLEIKSGGVGATQLASNAVTTAKITDANVTTAKIADGNVTTAKLADASVTDAKLASTFVKKYATSFGNGSLTSFTITHNLGTTDVIVQVQKVSDGTYQEFAITAATTNTVTIDCNSAPASNAFRAIVMG
jgi:hypothetical protein